MTMAADFNYSASLSTTQPNVTDLFLPRNDTPTSKCLNFGPNFVLPWNWPENIVSPYAEDFVHRIKYVVVLPILFVIGGPANVINMAVFYKQGLKERINVCLFAMSLCDFIELSCHIVFYSEQMYLQWITNFTFEDKFGPVMRFVINNNLLAFMGFQFATSLLSAIIASERCFCVVSPLRSQTVLKASTSAVIVTLCIVLTLVLYSFSMVAYKAQCIYDPVINKDAWSLYPTAFYFAHSRFISVVDDYIFGVIYPFVSMGVVVATTLVTIVKLHQAAAWRTGTSSSSSSSSNSRSSSSGGASSMEMSVTIMLVYNSIFFMVCMTPSCIIRLLQTTSSVFHRQHNLYLVYNWISDAISGINAAFKIVFYYTMGSRYRQTFRQLMGTCRRPTSNSKLTNAA